MLTLDELFTISDCIGYALCESYVTCEEEEETLIRLFHKVKNLIAIECNKIY